jgi:hypothetical protein
MKQVLTFVFEKDTKRMFRFTEASTVPIVGTIYVSKTAFPEGRPEKLTVTIEG